MIFCSDDIMIGHRNCACHWRGDYDVACETGSERGAWRASCSRLPHVSSAITPPHLRCGGGKVFRHSHASAAFLSTFCEQYVIWALRHGHVDR
jgi:hypothetical protein